MTTFLCLWAVFLGGIIQPIQAVITLDSSSTITLDDFEVGKTYFHQINNQYQYFPTNYGVGCKICSRIWVYAGSDNSIYIRFSFGGYGASWIKLN